METQASESTTQVSKPINWFQRQTTALKVIIVIGGIIFLCCSCTIFLGLVSPKTESSISDNTNQTNNNTNSLFKEINGISDGEIKKEEKVNLVIKTNPVVVDELKVNGEKIDLGFFSTEYKKEITLKEGNNEIKLTATKDGKTEEKIIKVKLDLTEKKQKEETERKAKEAEEARINALPAKERTELILTNLNMKKEEYAVSYDSSMKKITVTRNPYTAWDETAIVSDTFNDLVKLGKEVLKLQTVDELAIIYKAEFKNQYGQNTTENAVLISMKKANFQKFNWDNLVGQKIFDSIVINSSDYEINPAINNDLDKDKVRLR